MQTISYSITLVMFIFAVVNAMFANAGLFVDMLPTGVNIGDQQAKAAELVNQTSSVNSDALGTTISLAWKSMWFVLSAMYTFLFVGGVLMSIGVPWYVAAVPQSITWFCYVFDVWQLVPKILPYISK